MEWDDMKKPPGIVVVMWHRLSEDGEEDWGEGAVGGGDDFGGVGIRALVEVLAVPGIEYL